MAKFEQHGILQLRNRLQIAVANGHEWLVGDKNIGTPLDPIFAGGGANIFVPLENGYRSARLLRSRNTCLIGQFWYGKALRLRSGAISTRRFASHRNHLPYRLISCGQNFEYYAALASYYLNDTLVGFAMKNQYLPLRFAPRRSGSHECCEDYLRFPRGQPRLRYSKAFCCSEGYQS